MLRYDRSSTSRIKFSLPYFFSAIHYKIEVNLSLSPSATYNTIEANIIKKSCQEHSLTLLSVFQKPCSSPRLPTSLPQIRSNILNFQDTCEQRSGDDSSEKRIRLERPNHEPVRPRKMSFALAQCVIRAICRRHCVRSAT